MARQTRAQRAARREARGGEEGAAAPPRQPDRPVANGDDSGRPERRPEPQASAPAHAHPRRFNFIRESWGELQKVEWPTQPQLIQGTVVVLVACVIVGVYLWGADQIFRRLVQNVFLGQ
jgi:preprotein translocase SecE subunit